MDTEACRHKDTTTLRCLVSALGLIRLSGTYVQVTLQQGGINDLQELPVALDGRRAFHEWRGRGGVRVV